MYTIIFEQAICASEIKRIATECGASIVEDDASNFFGGGEIDFSVVSDGVCAIAAVTQIILQLYLNKERVILIKDNGVKIRNITLEDVKTILEEDAAQ